MDNSLIIAPGYPHSLLGHIRKLIKDNDMSFLVDNLTMLNEYRKVFPEDADGIYELETAYKLGMISEMAGILNDPDWRKRSFINKYAMILMHEDGMIERQMAELIETFMQIFDWNFELEVMRRWKTNEEDKADFHDRVIVEKSGREMHENNFDSPEGSGQQNSNNMDKKIEHNEILEQRVNNRRLNIGNEDILSRAVKDSFTAQGSLNSLANNISQVREENTMGRVLHGNTPVHNNDYNIDEVFDRMTPKEFIQNEILKNGIKFEQLMSRSEKNDIKRAIKGNADAQYRIAEFYALPNTAHTDYIQAAGWYKLSASQGNRKAQFALGMLYDSGKVKCKDYKKMALECYQALAESGFPTAQCTIGLKYRFGDGVEENIEEAARWLKKAAAQGHTDAQRNLGDMYLGIGNIEEAKRWFARAEALGDEYSKKQMERL